MLKRQTFSFNKACPENTKLTPETAWGTTCGGQMEWLGSGSSASVCQAGVGEEQDTVLETSGHVTIPPGLRTITVT